MNIQKSRIGTLDETLTYYVGPQGQIELAPDSRMRNPKLLGRVGWHCFEAKTAKEKDDVSKRMARQLWQKKRDQEVTRLRREQEQRNLLRTSAKIRQARSPSKLDYDLNQRVIDKMDRDDEAFFKLLVEEFDPNKRTSGLEIEWKEASSARPEKRVGLAN